MGWAGREASSVLGPSSGADPAAAGREPALGLQLEATHRWIWGPRPAEDGGLPDGFFTDSQPAHSHHCRPESPLPSQVAIHPPAARRHNGASGPLRGPGGVLNQSKLLQQEGRGTAVKC